MRFDVWLLCVLHCITATALGAAPSARSFTPAPERLKQIQQTLSDRPLLLDLAIDNRAAWQILGRTLGEERSLSVARSLARRPIPKTSRSLYLEYSRTGNRSRYEDMYFRKRCRLYHLVVAECIANQGEFLDSIEETITSICDEPTWCLPAHDPDFHNLEGRTRTIDLFVAETSWDLGVVYQWLGSRISQSLRCRIRNQLELQAFRPFEESVRTGVPELPWLKRTDNWNSVCLAGVTGAAITVTESIERRAFFIAAAENFIENFRAGFTSDGYCSEGVGYWNYGVGHYVNLAEAIHDATSGQINWYDCPDTRTLASFAWKIQLSTGIYPSFSDAPLGCRAHPLYTTTLSRRLNLPRPAGSHDVETLLAHDRPHLYELGLLIGKLQFGKFADASPAALPLRDEFSEACVFVLRPAATRDTDLAIAVKGGHNAEHHNHNDIGTYVIAVGGGTPLVDPGREVYTQRTFGPHRYDSNLINSFGHPVPRVAGQLQRSGREAAAKVLDKTYSDRHDNLVLDLTAGYDVDDLMSLKRRFDFVRGGGGRITITDHAKFASPQEFETALITASPWRQAEEHRFLIGEGASCINAEITSDPVDMLFEPVAIDEDTGDKSQIVRLAFRASQPTEELNVSFRFTRTGASSKSIPSVSDGDGNGISH